MANVVQDTAENRFEISVDGTVVGSSMYQLLDNSIVFTHTEIDEDRQQHGLGGELVQSALDTIRDTTRLRVVAQCPYVASWISKHPDYEALLSR